jgi:membrane protease YdiL (CAAX protease family)
MLYRPIEREKQVEEIELTRTQVKKGLAIIAAFIVLRLIAARLWQGLFGKIEIEASLRCALFVVAIFLVTSVGLVYFGFTRWVGIDLKRMWFDRKKIWGDIGWGLLTTFVVYFVIGTSVIALAVVGLMPQPPDVEPGELPPLHLAPVYVALYLFFGFAVRAFQEETIFRGFLQPILAEKYGKWRGNLFQAAVFSIAHIGLEPLHSLAGFLLPLLLRFGAGLVSGWLTMKRGTVLAAGVFHGFT